MVRDKHAEDAIPAKPSSGQTRNACRVGQSTKESGDHVPKDLRKGCSVVLAQCTMLIAEQCLQYLGGVVTVQLLVHKET